MTGDAVEARPVGNRGAGPSFLLRYGSQMGIIGVGLAMWLAFVIAAPRVFMDIDIYRAFAETTPLFGIVALSLTFVVITGEIDLSFPSVMALGTAVFCLVTAYGGAPWWVGLVCGLGTGALAGWSTASWSPRSIFPRSSSPSARSSCSAASNSC